MKTTIAILICAAISGCGNPEQAKPQTLEPSGRLTVQKFDIQGAPPTFLIVKDSQTGREFITAYYGGALVDLVEVAPKEIK